MWNTYILASQAVHAMPAYSTDCDDDDGGGLMCHVTDDSNYCYRMT